MTTQTPKLRFPGFSDKWVVKKLGEIANVYDGTHQTPTYVEKGIKFVSVENINNIEGTDKFITPESFEKDYKIKPRKGDILMTRITAGIIGATAIVKDNEPLGYYVSLALIRINTKISVEFLAHRIESIPFKKELHKRIIHVAFPKKINLGDISECEISLPQLPEQTRIANFLTAIDEKIQALKQKKTLLEQYKKGIMQQIFSQQLRFKNDDGSDFDDWEEKSLGEVANFRRGSFPQPYGLPKWYDDENGMPFIQVYDVDDNMLLKATTKNKISKLGAKQSVFVKKGTLVITIQGSIGRIAKTQYDAYIDRTLLIFQSYKLDMDIDYFKFVVFLLFEIEKTKAPGGIIKTITKEVLTEFKVPIPCLKEQQKIANFLTAIDEKIEKASQQITATETYKKGFLQQMFV